MPAISSPLSHTLPRELFATLEKPASFKRLMPALSWVLAIFTILHTYFLGVQGDTTNDYGPVYYSVRRFIQHWTVYSANLNLVNPHYLYPPSGTLLLLPLGFHSYASSRTFLIIISTAAIITATIMLLTKIGISLKSATIPVVLFLVFSTESVIHTLTFTNINGLVFLAEVIFLCLFLDDSPKNSIIAGVVLGLTFSFKPVLFPLLLLPFIYRKYTCLSISLLVPIGLNIIALSMTVDGMAFFYRTLPYILSPRNFYNSAIVPMMGFYGVNPIITIVIRIFIALLAIATVLVLWRIIGREKLLFSYTYAGFSVTALFLLGTLGQGYYSMLIFPLLLTIFLRDHCVSNIVTWIGTYLCLSGDSWYSFKWPTLGGNIENWRFTCGWICIILGVSACTILQYLSFSAQQNNENSKHTIINT